MRNKDIKLKDLKITAEASKSTSETLIMEDCNTSYAVLLENYYCDLKSGAVAIPEENEISEFIDELIWFNNLEIEDATIH